MTASPDLTALLAALGGAGNVDVLEPCITRLRVEVHDPSLVDREALRGVGSHGVSVVGSVVQVIVGPNADALASELGDLLG